VTVPGSIHSLPDVHPANELLLALVGGTADAEPKAWGSAVFIAPGVALTASHVLKAYWKFFDTLGRWDEDTSAEFALQALQYLPSRAEPIVWHVVGAWHSGAIDIAVLQLEPEGDLPADYRWPYPTLNVWPPVVGTEAQALGFPVGDVAYSATAQGWALAHAATGSVGKVTQCFPVRRDRTLLHYPSFEMDVETVDGMSGGGIFDRAGHLRGIICSGIDAAEAGPHVTYGSILWPSLGLPIHPTPHLGLSEGDTRLLNLARDGRLTVLHAKRLPSEPADLMPAAVQSGGDQPPAKKA
jgi:hypothetical protein